VENRTWATKIRGKIAIHASKSFRKAEYLEFMQCASGGLFPECSSLAFIPHYPQFEVGVILGTVELVDCVTESNSEWFFGDYGFVLENPRQLIKPIPFRGALGFWEIPKDIESELNNNKLYEN